MPKECIVPENGPRAAGPYSVVVRAGDFLFVSGQVAMGPDGPRKGTFAQEVQWTLENLRAALEGAGSGLDQVVKTTVFLADMDRFGEFNEIYATFFPSNPPARTCVQVARLPLDFQVEIEAIAVCSEVS